MEEDDAREYATFIQNQFTWEKLPPQVKARLQNSKELWKDKVIKYSTKHQLRWKTNLVRTMLGDERSYYQQILKTSRLQYMLYPYHISDVLIKGLRVTPFKYYLDMMQDVMKAEYSYDRLPNFTATDCVRLLGVGRNEFIDIMNKCRAKGWLWKMKKGLVKDLLPTQPVDIEIDYWWLVNVGFVSEEDIRNCTELEHRTVDLLIDTGAKQAGLLDKKCVKSLHRRGLIYLDVPISNDDYISIPPLENFVMNRVGGDYFETLLYKIFVSMDERTSIETLAHVLDMDIEIVKQAVSMYCRLGFAKKKSVEPLTDNPKWHPSWRNFTEFSLDQSTNYSNLKLSDLVNSASVSGSPQRPRPFAESSTGTPNTGFVVPTHTKRIGFLFDYTLTALLMMGNLGSGLKSHAVTMYEVGKLSDESLDDFINELEKVKEVAEGEAQRYHDHAITLREMLKFLRSCKVTGADGVDLLRCERLNSLEPVTRERLLFQNYGLLISMAPISLETQTITSCIPQHFGPAIPEFTSLWFKFYLYKCARSGPDTLYLTKGTRVYTLPKVIEDYETVQLIVDINDPIVVPVATLLPLLNDMLVESPVLVQGHAKLAPVWFVDVPFPVQEVDASSEDSTNREYDEDNLWSHPTVQRIQRVFRLRNNFGFLKMLRIQELSGARWVPYELHFGMPLGDGALNRKICGKIEEFSLFEPESLALQSRHSRELCLRLLDFINTCNEMNVVLDGSTVIAPRKTLEFSGGKLRRRT